MSNHDEECNCAQSLRLKKEVEELQERFMRLRRDVIEIVLEKKGIAEATTVEPVERRNGRPHVHRAVREATIADVAYQWCKCGARSECSPDKHTWSPWVEPVAAADESEPGDCERCHAAISQRQDDAPTAICDHCAQELAKPIWAACRAQQPPTVTAPEPTLEAQRDAAFQRWRKSGNARGAK